jgi:hypothetical protein
MMRRMRPRQVMVTTKIRPSISPVQLNAGFAVVVAIVDDIERGSIEQRCHVEEIDSVLDEVAFPLFLVPLEGHCQAIWRDLANRVNTFVIALAVCALHNPYAGLRPVRRASWL